MLFKTSFIFFQMRFFRLLQGGLIQWPFVGSDMILNVKDLFTRIVIHGLFKNLKFKILSRLGNLDIMPF